MNSSERIEIRKILQLHFLPCERTERKGKRTKSKQFSSFRSIKCEEVSLFSFFPAAEMSPSSTLARMFQHDTCTN